MDRRKFIIWLFLFIIGSTAVSAQNSISVSSHYPKYMELIPDYSETSSQKVTYQYTQWINYTTLIDLYYDPAFSITVQLVSKKAPRGLELLAKTDFYKGLSKGEVGTPTGMKQALPGGGARVLINNITTCFTGSGRGQGHLTTLTFSAPSLPGTDTTAYMVNVVYTLVQ